MIKGRGLLNKYKNKRIEVFISDDGSVQIKTKRLRKNTREPVIVGSEIRYYEETFKQIVGMWLQLQTDDKKPSVSRPT